MWEIWKQPTVLKTSRSEAILRGNGEMPVGWTVLWNEISTLPTENEASFTFLFSNKGKWTAGEWLHERYHLNFPFEKIYNYLSSAVTVANFLSHVISSLPFWCRNTAHFNSHFTLEASNLQYGVYLTATKKAVASPYEFKVTTSVVSNSANRVLVKVLVPTFRYKRMTILKSSQTVIQSLLWELTTVQLAEVSKEIQFKKVPPG